MVDCQVLIYCIIAIFRDEEITCLFKVSYTVCMQHLLVVCRLKGNNSLCLKYLAMNGVCAALLTGS